MTGCRIRAKYASFGFRKFCREKVCLVSSCFIYFSLEPRIPFLLMCQVWMTIFILETSENGIFAFYCRIHLRTAAGYRKVDFCALMALPWPQWHCIMQWFAYMNPLLELGSEFKRKKVFPFFLEKRLMWPHCFCNFRNYYICPSYILKKAVEVKKIIHFKVRKCWNLSCLGNLILAQFYVWLVTRVFNCDDILDFSTLTSFSSRNEKGSLN